MCGGGVRLIWGKLKTLITSSPNYNIVYKKHANEQRRLMGLGLPHLPRSSSLTSSSFLIFLNPHLHHLPHRPQSSSSSWLEVIVMLPQADDASLTSDVTTSGLCAIVVIELGFGLRGRRQIQERDFTNVRKGDVFLFFIFYFYVA